MQQHAFVRRFFVTVRNLVPHGRLRQLGKIGGRDRNRLTGLVADQQDTLARRLSGRAGAAGSPAQVQIAGSERANDNNQIRATSSFLSGLARQRQAACGHGPRTAFISSILRSKWYARAVRRRHYRARSKNNATRQEARLFEKAGLLKKEQSALCPTTAHTFPASQRMEIQARRASEWVRSGLAIANQTHSLARRACIMPASGPEEEDLHSTGAASACPTSRRVARLNRGSASEGSPAGVARIRPGPARTAAA